jgi:predicted nucleic acid-binding protein
MPRKKDKITEEDAFYIDTNIALDYITGRNLEAISVLDSLKAMGATIVSSSFLVMEAADFRKDSIYFSQKMTKGNWEIRKIIRQSYKKDLNEGDFDGVSDWVEELTGKLELELYDFLVNTDTWELAQYISQSSNLAAPDVIHLSSAIIVAQSGIDRGIVLQCKILISNDGFLKKEAKKIKQQLNISYPEILTLSEVKKRFLKAEEAKMGTKGRKNIKKPKKSKKK